MLRPELPPQRAPELTLVAAVAVAETLRDAGVEASIKWPNDLQVGGKKIAGILTELSAEPDRVHFVVLGIGVNLNVRRQRLPAGASREIATSLMEARGQRVPRALFAAALLTRLEEWLDAHAEEGFGPVREAWKPLSSTLGQEVLVQVRAPGARAGSPRTSTRPGRCWCAPPTAGWSGCSPATSSRFGRARRREAERTPAALIDSAAMLLAIDVGNTNTVLGVYDGREAPGALAPRDPVRAAPTTSTASWSASCFAVRRHRPGQGAGAVAVSSVVPPLQFTLEQMSRALLQVRADVRRARA